MLRMVNSVEQYSAVVDELPSSQEEADRILMHAKQHASDIGYKYVMVVSEDSDVYVLCIALATDINSSFFIREEELKQGRGTWTSNN